MLNRIADKWNDTAESDPLDRWSAHQGRNVGIGRTESTLALAAAVGATFLARHAIRSSWRMVLHREPPQNPASPRVEWKEALLWGAASGAIVGMVRIASRRAASGAYHKLRA